MKKNIKIIFVFAIILRLIIAPLFFHPDIKTQNYHLQFFSRGVFNIYQYVSDHKEQLPYRDTFNYLPLTYLSLGLQQLILKPILPSNFYTWINDWSASQNNYPNLFYFMLILKIPYLFFDMGIAYLLYKIYGQKILNLWLFNPFSIYLIYVLANFDVIPVFFSLLAYYYLRQHKNFIAFAFLGIATALKLYPLLLFPFFIFYYHHKIKNLIANTFAFILPLLLSILPFISNPAFIQAFSGSGLTQKIIENKFMNISIYPVIYLLVFIFYFFQRQKKIENSFLYLFLAFIIFVNYHPQWLLWFLPFIIAPIIQNKIKTIIFTIISSLCLLYTFITNDQFLFWGHFLPINYDFLSLTTPYQIVLHKFHYLPELLQIKIKYLTAFLSLLLLIPKHEKNN